MIESKTIDEIYSRFRVDELRSQGKTYKSQERIWIILISLPINWSSMVNIMTQLNNINTQSLEGIIWSLRAHEVILEEDKPSRKGKMVSLKPSQSNS